MLMSMVAGSGFRLEALALWQGTVSLSGTHADLLVWFVGIIALGTLVQLIAVAAAAVVALKVKRSLTSEVQEIKGKLMPLIEKSHGLVAELTPKITNITANVEHISYVVREKVVEFEPTVAAANVTIKEANATARDVNAKAHAQIVRVNGMVTTVLNASAEIGEKIHHGIRVPVREIEGIIGGARAAIDSLMSKARGFGGGIRTEPVRPSGRRAGYGARPASSVVRPPQSAGIDLVKAAEESEAAK